MGTTAILDVTRSELTERAFNHSKHASDIHPTSGGKNLIFQWPGTKTWTLMPVNFTTDFVESKNYEAVKFRLADVIYNPDWWTEVPEHTILGEKADYFFNAVVKNTNWTSSNSGRLMDLLVDIGGIAVTNAIKFEQDHGVGAFRSINTFPANQGYVIRWHQEGRPSFSRGAILEFYFGDFAISLSTNGKGYLYQTPDFVSGYGLVDVFSWCNEDEVHGRLHRIVIFPHARNQIEILGIQKADYIADIIAGATKFHANSAHVNVFKVPGELLYQADGVTPLITQPGGWYLKVHREFRPYIQVARLAFANGGASADGNATASLFDEYCDMGFAPSRTFDTPNVDIDTNGGVWFTNVFDAFTGQAFVADGKNRTPQFRIGLGGKGDIQDGTGSKGISSTTPELYGYTMHKPAVFTRIERQAVPSKVMHISMDYGNSPEEERLNLVLNNSQNQLISFVNRSDIPLQVVDDVNGLCFFEGTVEKVFSSENPATDAKTLRMVAIGMADNMKRDQWGIHSPDFSRDPANQQGLAFYWTDAVKRTFESAGYDSETQVVIEDEAKYKFRLWLDGSTDGQTGNGGNKGAAQTGSRWHPAPLSFVYEFMEYLLVQILGWHWYWDRSDHKWHAYKRPFPYIPADASKYNPKVQFFTKVQDYLNAGGLNANPPAYLAAKSERETERPECNTVLIKTIHAEESNVQTKNEHYNNLVQLTNVTVTETADASTKQQPRYSLTQLENYNGFANDKHPNPDKTSVDFLGRQHTRLIPLWSIATKDGIQFVGRRFFEALCFGRVWMTWEANWGDANTYNLRKWDCVLYNGIKYMIDRVEPAWGGGGEIRRAKYRASLARTDVPPPH